MDQQDRRIVCVDLNGVLDRYAGWREDTHWDPPREGAREVLAFGAYWEERPRDG